MAGKFRRKFVDIINDKIAEHYRGKVLEHELTDVMNKVRRIVENLDKCKAKEKIQHTEQLQKLKKMPLEKLQKILGDKA